MAKKLCHLLIAYGLYDMAVQLIEIFYLWRS